MAYEQDEAAAEVENLLKKHTPFDGLFIYGDWATIGAVNTLRKHGVRIPEDVSVVMYDDFSFVERVLGLRVTAIRQPFPELIGYAVRILLNRLDNGRNGNLAQIIQPRLMIRDSTIPRHSGSSAAAGAEFRKGKSQGHQLYFQSETGGERRFAV